MVGEGYELCVLFGGVGIDGDVWGGGGGYGMWCLWEGGGGGCRGGVCMSVCVYMYVCVCECVCVCACVGGGGSSFVCVCGGVCH